MKQHSSQVDYRAYAEKFATLLEEFVSLHSGGDGRDLVSVFGPAIVALDDYARATGPARVSLKTLMKLAVQQAEESTKDPYGEMLRVIACRAKDYYNHIDEDREAYLDVKQWLEYEADLEVEE